MSLKELLQAEAERLGFTLFGVTTPARPPHLSVYEQWLEAGLHAGMGYLAAERARERRAQPEQIQPGSRSVLLVGMRYFSDASSQASAHDEPRGRVAAYAWGDDYHDVIPPRLEALAALLEKQLGQPVQSKAYTDTGPVLERDFAQRAGLGWSGKNTCLISPRHGSYFLLGETFVSAEIEPDPPFTSDHCGSCRRCIESCPTEAIRPDRTIDSGRCISYLTIENKGSIPPELRPKLGSWIFGCDICQDVCPWNLRFAQSQGHAALLPRPGVPNPALREELSLTAQDFNRKFRGSPIQRAKRRGYLRNVAVALGNQQDTAAVPDLAQALENDPEPLVRAHAAWALGRLRTRLAQQALEKSLRADPDADVQAEIRAIL